jgi:hypothetical protein
MMGCCLSSSVRLIFLSHFSIRGGSAHLWRLSAVTVAEEAIPPPHHHYLMINGRYVRWPLVCGPSNENDVSPVIVS